MTRLDGSVVLVAGHAGSVGTIARRLRELGASVVVADSGSGLRAAADASGLEDFEAVDVGSQSKEAWQGAGEVLLSRHSRWDGLVCCAGGVASGSIESVTDEQWADAMRGNVEAVANACQAAVSRFTGRRGSIVIVASVGGLVAGEDMFLADTISGAVRLLTKSVALRCIDLGVRIRCNSIHSTALPVGGDAGACDGYHSAGAAVARGPALPSTMVEVAEFAAFLLGPGSEGISAAEFVADGGRTAR